MQPMVLRGGKAVLPEGVAQVDILLEGGRIAAIGPALPAEVQAQCLNLHGQWVVPGLIDIHTHGGAGVDVNHGDVESLGAMAAFFATQGVTAFLPTVLSDSEAKMAQALEQIAQARALEGGAAILGCHLEGPFLAEAYKGAMPEAYLRDGDGALFARLQQAAEGCIRLVTLSPERPGALQLIPQLAAQGVVVSLGHTGATYQQAMACIQAGAASTTHTFNGMAPLHQHQPGMLGAALESNLYCEMICDGFHLHPGIVRLLLKAKGIRRLVAVTDSIMAAGLGDGDYVLGAQPIVVSGGDALLRDGSSRAGSTLVMPAALRNLMAYTGLPLEEALLPLTANPAALLGLAQKGRLALGMDGDIAVLDEALQVRHTLVAGRLVYSAA